MTFSLENLRSCGWISVRPGPNSVTAEMCFSTADQRMRVPFAAGRGVAAAIPAAGLAQVAYALHAKASRVIAVKMYIGPFTNLHVPLWMAF